MNDNMQAVKEILNGARNLIEALQTKQIETNFASTVLYNLSNQFRQLKRKGLSSYEEKLINTHLDNIGYFIKLA